LAKARILARYIYDEKYALEYFQAAVNEVQRVPDAAQYGLALALLRNGKANEADAILTKLRETDRDNMFYIDTMTDILIAQNKPKQAVELLTKQLEKSPRNAVITLNLANAAIEAKQFEKAKQVLRDFQLLNPTHLLSYQLLSDAYAKSQQYLEMHQTNAEMFVLYAAFPRAIDQLQHAYNFTGEDHLVKQRIRARIQQLRDEQAKLERLF
jgi:predicted Zn-dependent protease